MESVGAIGSSTVGAAGNRFGELSSEQFIEIIFTELSNQDPLEPNDTGALIEQMSTLQSMQSDMELTNRLEAIVSQNELAGAAGMIGRSITGFTETGVRVSGTVASVTRTGEGPILNLDSGSRVPASYVEQIVDPPSVSSGSSGGGAS
jgi:flagellar basal-body rod modification protein FlgD